MILKIKIFLILSISLIPVNTHCADNFNMKNIAYAFVLTGCSASLLYKFISKIKNKPLNDKEIYNEKRECESKYKTESDKALCYRSNVESTQELLLKINSLLTPKINNKILNYLGEYQSIEDIDHIANCFVALYENRVAVGYKNVIRIFDINLTRCLLTINAHTDWITQLYLLRDGSLVSGSLDHTIKIWDTKTGKLIQELDNQQDDWVVNFCSLPNGDLVAGSYKGIIKIWDSFTTDCVRILVGHNCEITSLTSLKHKYLISGSCDNTIKIWNVEDVECLNTLIGHDEKITNLCILPNEKLASCSNDKTIKIWDLTTGQCLQTIADPNWFRILWILPNGNYAVVNNKKNIHLGNLFTGIVSYQINDDTFFIKQLMSLPSGNLLTLSDHGVLKIWQR